jgi:MYXO-CTERM domain-containing protein
MSGVPKAYLFCYTLFMTWTDDEDSGVPVTAAAADAETTGRALAVGLLVVGAFGFICRRELFSCVYVCVCV